ncbi:cyanoexosortase B system-associated protein [Pannus brasiliensis CCIBt3594]|uniref:Cyanoexosortase B system-associated protein n=1 Tax=Pannus brasiliensis CCIBt3594 TaxID=1427578 RepID=A0AAW9QTU3_9CHRO
MNKGKISGEMTLSIGDRKVRVPANYVLVAILLLSVAIGAIARDLARGNFAWIDAPRIGNIQKMNVLKESGIEIAGRTTIDRRQVNIGEGTWSAQLVEGPDAKRVTVLLKPQDYYKKQPEVEWSDINSIARWKTEPANDLTFSTPSGGTVTARFFRAWQSNTFAVVQWYAWLGGGHHDTAVWFWLDQQARLQNRRVPWIAVSLHIPLDPTRSVETMRPTARDLARQVQEQLETTVLSKLSTVPTRK